MAKMTVEIASTSRPEPTVRAAPASQWSASEFSVSTTPYLQCVAVSTTADATGSYFRYAFS